MSIMQGRRGGGCFVICSCGDGVYCSFQSAESEGIMNVGLMYLQLSQQT